MQMLPQELRPDGSPRSTSNTAPTQHAGFCNISGRPFATLLSQRTDKHQPWPCLALPPYIVDSCPLLFFLHFPCFQFVSLVLCCFFFLFFFLIFSIFLSLLSSLFSLTYLLFFFFFFFATCSYPCLGGSEHCGIRPAHPAPVSASRPVVQT